MVLDVQVAEVQEDAVVDVHADDPRTVHVVGVAAGVRWGVDLPRRSCDGTPATCGTEKRRVRVRVRTGQT